MTRPKSDVSRALRRWRKAAGFTAVKAADYLEVPIHAYRHWEAGRVMPYPKILRMALALELLHVQLPAE